MKRLLKQQKALLAEETAWTSFLLMRLRKQAAVPKKPKIEALARAELLWLIPPNLMHGAKTGVPALFSGKFSVELEHQFYTTV